MTFTIVWHRGQTFLSGASPGVTVAAPTRGQDRRRERRTRGWSGWRHGFLSGPKECEEQGCGENGEGEEACEHRHAARHSHTTAGSPVRATRFSLLNVSEVASPAECPGKSLMNPDVRRPAGPDMPEIVECVPNFSEGRRTEVVDTIAQAIASVPGVRVLDQEMDADHNRSVITFVGDRTSVAE